VLRAEREEKREFKKLKILRFCGDDDERSFLDHSSSSS
jgi:hypothetical protein